METLTPNNLRQVAQDFVLNEVSDLLSVTLGDDRKELALDLEHHETTDLNGHRRETFEIEQLIERCFQFAVERRQGADDDADQQMLRSLVEFDAGALVVDSTLNERRKELGGLLELHEAVMAFEYGEDKDTLTREQVALLSGLAVETVRLAAFAEGEDKLPQERPGVARKADVQRWLIHKGRYREFKWLPPFVLKPETACSSARELAETIYGQALRKLEKATEVFPIVPAEHRAGFEEFLSSRQFNPDEQQWVTIENAERLGTALMIDPCWLFENLDLWASDARRRQLVSQLAEQIARKTPPKALPGSAAGKETVRAVLAKHPSVEKHPAQRKPNAKIDGYRVVGGLAFAHQHEGKTQFLWIPDDIAVPESAIAKHYPAVGPDEASTRHSGLAKFPELHRSAVNKVKLKDSDSFNEILDRLAAS
jgi:hypothetical protein